MKASAIVSGDVNLLPLCETVFGTEPDLVLALMYDQKRFGLLQTDDAIESRYSLCLRSMRALLSRRSLRYFSQAGFWEVRATPPRSRDKAFFSSRILFMQEMDYLAIYPRRTVNVTDFYFWNMLFNTRDE